MFLTHHIRWFGRHSDGWIEIRAGTPAGKGRQEFALIPGIPIPVLLPSIRHFCVEESWHSLRLESRKCSHNIYEITNYADTTPLRFGGEGTFGAAFRPAPHTSMSPAIVILVARDPMMMPMDSRDASRRCTCCKLVLAPFFLFSFFVFRITICSHLTLVFLPA
ncbi:hypothetical protein F5Y14DRAFT_135055 [Nemania sp. NC0429]|nr:hypothetical protein F5Y14DRAFT_135055 [Nemania sp. NC0429]